MSEWISTRDRVPDDQKAVLVVKQLKGGQRIIGMGYCIKDYAWKDYRTGEVIRKPYWVCGGSNNVVYWMPLPDLPDEAFQCGKIIITKKEAEGNGDETGGL